MAEQANLVGTGVPELDRLLGGLRLGDNLVWQDDAGSLAGEFCYNLILASSARQRPVAYLSFDRPPREVLAWLGALADYPGLVVLDCRGRGRGGGGPRRSRPAGAPPGRVRRAERPQDPGMMGELLTSLHGELGDGMRLIFDSLAGMAQLWGGGEAASRFFAQTGPRLAALEAAAYWIMGKQALPPRFKAAVAQGASAVVELAIKRGATSLTVLKADHPPEGARPRPHNYWARDHQVVFAEPGQAPGLAELGLKLKDLRMKRGLSQTGLARLVGVTPSTISQVESSHIHPSLPALVRMAEVLGVEVASLFEPEAGRARRLVFPAGQAVEVKLEEMPPGQVSARLLCPLDFAGSAEPYLIEVAPGAELESHWFEHKGQEVGYLLSGRLGMKARRSLHEIAAGDLVYLTKDIPTQWSNPGPEPAKLLWLKLS